MPLGQAVSMMQESLLTPHCSRFPANIHMHKTYSTHVTLQKILSTLVL